MEQALHMVHEAARRGGALRLFGGVAVVRLVSIPVLPRPDVKDLDLVCLTKDILLVRDVLDECGYEEELEITRLFGDERRRFRHRVSGLYADLCLDKLHFSRVIDLRNRLRMRPVTISVADLLLAKLQARELASVDVIDIVNLMSAFEPSEVEDDTGFEVARVAQTCGRDWGLYVLVVENCGIVEEAVANCLAVVERRAELLRRIAMLRRKLTEHPKTVMWHLRALVGRRTRYWDEVSDGEDIS